MKRRALVLTHEESGHPFRRSLPSHVLACDPEGEQQIDAQAALEWRLNGGDWKSFLSTYCATFVAVLAFIV